MKKYTLLFLGFIMIISCNENGKQYLEPSKIENNKPMIITKTDTNDLLSKVNSDTLIIKGKCAVIYEPTEEYIDKSKKEVGEDNFYIGTDDALFYISESTEYLNSKGIKIVNTKNDKILKFISNNKSVTLKQLNLEKEMFGIYLFDPNQKPKKINIVNVSSEFESYMK